jgi:hypothetical protein
METKKHDGPEKVRFLEERDEIYKWYTVQQKANDQVASSALKRSISQREEEGEVIEQCLGNSVINPPKRNESFVRNDQWTAQNGRPLVRLIPSE